LHWGKTVFVKKQEKKNGRLFTNVLSRPVGGKKAWREQVVLPQRGNTLGGLGKDFRGENNQDRDPKKPVTSCSGGGLLPQNKKL